MFKQPIRHTRKDGELTVRMALPGTGKTGYSDVIDIGQPGGVDNAWINVRHDATPNMAADKKAVITLESSGDQDDWTDVSGFSLEATKEAGLLRDRMPISIGRYVRLKVVMDASSGDNTASFAELAISL